MLQNFYGDKVRKGGNKLFGRGRGFIIIITYMGRYHWLGFAQPGGRGRAGEGAGRRERRQAEQQHTWASDSFFEKKPK